MYIYYIVIFLTRRYNPIAHPNSSVGLFNIYHIKIKYSLRSVGLSNIYHIKFKYSLRSTNNDKTFAMTNSTTFHYLNCDSLYLYLQTHQKFPTHINSELDTNSKKVLNIFGYKLNLLY